jgi:hypothetical protein
MRSSLVSVSAPKLQKPPATPYTACGPMLFTRKPANSNGTAREICTVAMFGGVHPAKQGVGYAPLKQQVFADPGDAHASSAHG